VSAESPVNRALRIIREELVCASIEYDEQAEKDRVAEALGCLILVETHIAEMRKQHNEDLRDAQRDCAASFAEASTHAQGVGRGEW
jgi:hypothetical protein